MILGIDVDRVTLKILYCFSYLRKIKQYKAIINPTLKLLSDRNK